MALIRSSLYSYISSFYLDVVRKKLISLQFYEHRYSEELNIYLMENNEKVIRCNKEIKYLFNPNYSPDKLVNSCNIAYFFAEKFDSSIFSFSEEKKISHFGFKYRKDDLFILLIEVDDLIMINAYVESENYKYSENILMKLSRELIKINIELKKIACYLF